MFRRSYAWRDTGERKRVEGWFHHVGLKRKSNAGKKGRKMERPRKGEVRKKTQEGISIGQCAKRR